MAGIIVGTMAIIIVASVMNGFSSLLEVFYSDFDPDIKITAVEGKMFEPQKAFSDKIKAIDGVISYAEIVEEMAFLKYGKQQYPAIVKGVPDNYTTYTNIDKRIIEGEYYLEKDGINYTVLGRGVANQLQAGVSFLDPIRIYFPKKGKQVSLNPSRSFNTDYIFPSAVFAILEDVDAQYILVSKKYASKLFESGTQVSAIELDLTEGADVKTIQNSIEQIVGEQFHVKNKEQQRDLIYKTMKSEKTWVFIILVFILLLASGNMIGNLTMLYIDKKEDIAILSSMGLPMKNINRIFLYEGWLISFVGGVVGTILGVFVCWLQIQFEIIKLPGAGNSFIISAYPIDIIFTDIVLAFIAIMVIGFAASWYPVKFMSKKHLSESNIV